MGTYALKTTILVPDNKRRMAKTAYITVQQGLTWQQAKARRNRDHKRDPQLSIVPERCG
jgi:hypothetical protein